MDTVKQMQRELEEVSCVTSELLSSATASRHSNSIGGAAVAVAAAARLKRGHPPATAVTSSSTLARFPGDAPPACLIGLDADPNATMEALYPTHNRYVRQQQLPDVKATNKSYNILFAKLLVPSRSGRATTTLGPVVLGVRVGGGGGGRALLVGG